LFIAGTGVGKTVIIPKLLAHHFNYETPIICTTPRTETTSSAAIYSAFLMDVPIYVPDENDPTGKTIKRDENGNKVESGELYVGYTHSKDKTHYDSKQTKLLFCTDGTIKAWILGNDPYLSKFGGVIIDEAHERNANIDIILSLLCNIARARPEFRIIIMSATVNENIFIEFFRDKQKFGDKFTMMNMSAAPTQFVIHPEYVPKPIPKKMLLSKAQEVLAMINKVMMDPKIIPGDILVFLKGSTEIKNIKIAIDNAYDTYPENNKPYAVPLNATAEPYDKDIALKKDGLERAMKKMNKTYHRKIILATNTAESSITFDADVGYVIDSGLIVAPIYNPEIDAYSNEPLYVSDAAIKQRCGRTGRTCTGKCIHLYTKYYQEKLFMKYAIPDIRKGDFTKTLLDIMSIPSNQGRLTLALEFIKDMIEPVENMMQLIKRAVANLDSNGMIVGGVVLGTNRERIITPLGKLALDFEHINLSFIENARLVAAAHFFSPVQEYREFYVACALIMIVYLENQKIYTTTFANLFKLPPEDTKENAEYIAKKGFNNNYIPPEYLDTLKRDGHLHPSGEVLSLVKIIMYFNRCVLTVPNFDPQAFCKKYRLLYKTIKDINEKVSEYKSLYTRSMRKYEGSPLFEHYMPDLTKQSGGAAPVGGKPGFKPGAGKPFAGPPRQPDEPPVETWDETPYLTKLKALPEPNDPNFALNKVIEGKLQQLTNKYTQPLKLNIAEVMKPGADAIWDNVLFILFYGFFNRIAARKYGDNPENKYYMRNSNIEVGFPDSILSYYYTNKPDFIVYNSCVTGPHFQEFKNPLGKTEFPIVNEIPISIINRYTEIPLYDEAVKYISKKK
jgi:hypothetical protein